MAMLRGRPGYGNIDFQMDSVHAGGSMAVYRESTWLPFDHYKLTDDYTEKQLPKPQYPSRNPNLREVRHWETKNGHVQEVGGTRMYIGACEHCEGLVFQTRDVSGPEFRGKFNEGKRGRWRRYCDGCREVREAEQRERKMESMRRLREDPSARKQDYRPRKADWELQGPRR